MSLLIESVKLMDGEFYNLGDHEARMKSSRAQLFGTKVPIQLERLVMSQEYPKAGLHKCRIVYDDLSFEVSFSPYTIRRVRSVRVVGDDTISYPFKFADRSAINRLYDMRGDCDDVLIVRAGRVTDCSYSNVAFKKDGHWYTPDSPLLPGTMRAKLLREGRIRSKEIWKEDIRSFDGLRLINAMLEFDGPEIDVSNIVF